MPYVADDADHREGPEVTVHVAEIHELAYRILARPGARGEQLAHQRGMRRGDLIASLERTPLHERNPHGAKVIAVHDPVLGVSLLRRRIVGPCRNRHWL